MLACGFDDLGELLAVGAGAEEEDHDEGVGEADLGTVDEPITRGLDDGEEIVVDGVAEEGREEFLGGVHL